MFFICLFSFRGQWLWFTQYLWRVGSSWWQFLFRYMSISFALSFNRMMDFISRVRALFVFIPHSYRIDLIKKYFLISCILFAHSMCVLVIYNLFTLFFYYYYSLQLEFCALWAHSPSFVRFLCFFFLEISLFELWCL